MTNTRKNEIISKYIEDLYNGIDYKDLYQFFYDIVSENLENNQEKEFVEIIESYYDCKIDEI